MRNVEKNSEEALKVSIDQEKEETFKQEPVKKTRGMNLKGCSKSVENNAEDEKPNPSRKIRGRKKRDPEETETRSEKNNIESKSLAEMRRQKKSTGKKVMKNKISKSVEEIKTEPSDQQLFDDKPKETHKATKTKAREGGDPGGEDKGDAGYMA